MPSSKHAGRSTHWPRTERKKAAARSVSPRSAEAGGAWAAARRRRRRGPADGVRMVPVVPAIAARGGRRRDYRKVEGF